MQETHAIVAKIFFELTIYSELFTEAGDVNSQEIVFSKHRCNTMKINISSVFNVRIS